MERMGIISRKTQRRILSTCVGITTLLFIAGIFYFGYILVLRTQWKSLKNDIADAINGALYSSPEMLCGEDTLPFTKQDELYFSKFLSDPYFLPVRAGELSPCERSIQIKLDGSSLVFTPCGDGTIIHIQLNTESASKGFYARSSVNFFHLERYFKSRIQYAN